MQRKLHENSLSIIMLLLFALSLVGQSVTGHHVHNQDQKEHGQQTISYADYLTSGHFVEATFENWESEFLQMGMYVVLTIFLYQKGSSESKTPGTVDRVDVIPEKHLLDENAPLRFPLLS